MINESPQKDKTISELLESIIQIINKYIKEEHEIYIFGSWAKGKSLDTSDLDIAVESTVKIKDEVFIKIKEDINNLPTLRTIDIIDLKRVSKNFRENILKYAKKLN